MLNALSFLPIIALLVGLIGLKFTAVKSGMIALVLTTVIAVLAFGLEAQGLLIAVGKGLSLAFYVLVIIWSALFLYHVVWAFKAIQTITANIMHFIRDPFVQFLMLAWLFSAALQGVAGFGVPVVIVVPILISLGFEPIRSTVAVLLGHSWAVSFGSMGSSFYTISLVTNLEPQQVGFAMAIFNCVAMVMMGLFVCYFYDGFKDVKRGLFYILPTSLVMMATMSLSLYLNLLSMVSLLSALAGLLTLYILFRIREKPLKKEKLRVEHMSIWTALLPYAIILGLTLGFQMLPLDHLALSFRFDASQTSLGYVVKAEEAFAKLKLFGHPGPVLLMAAFGALLAYHRLGQFNQETFKNVVQMTVKKCLPTTKSLTALIVMALVMMDSGMTEKMAYTVTLLTGSFYVFFAPFIGVLGSFITGSNTNSNVLFGKFQYDIATALGVSPYLMCGVQSIAGSIGVGLGPTTLLMSATAAGLNGQESNLYRRVLPPILLTAGLMGLLHGLLQYMVQ
jgi:lactate permease